MRRFLVVVIFAALLVPQTAIASDCSWDQSSGWVQRENSKSGTAEWAAETPLRFSADFTRRKAKQRVEGYFGATSVGCGEKTPLTIIGAPSADISIYRIGYYKGAGARLVMTVNSAKSFTANAKTPPGEYLVKLNSPGRASSFVPIVVRSQSIKSEITFVSSVLTWQAYNQWGGTSLYKGADGARETRAASVTFDRPFDGDGAGQFRYMEEPLVQLIEQLGIDTQYITDIDLDKAERINSGSIVFGGHSEFWSYSMRSAIEKAIASGKNLIVLGGNTGYAQTLLDERLLIGRNPFRDLGMPESKILGSQFFALGIKKDLESQNRWPFSVLGENAVIKGVYGNEADTAMGAIGPGVEILARASISPTEKGFVAMSTYYSAPSGATVLNMGTNGWVCAMANRCPWGYMFDGQAQQQIKLVTATLLKAAKSGNWRAAKIDIPTRS